MREVKFYVWGENIASLGKSVRARIEVWRFGELP
jgi:hypothetical protein